MKTFTIVSDYDGNDSFTVEARSEKEAAIDALGVLGWIVCSPDPSPPEREKKSSSQATAPKPKKALP